MKKNLILLIILLSQLSVSSSETDLNSLFSSGVESYNNGSFKESILIFTECLENGYQSPQIYYNLANSYYRNADFANAIWCYEKTLLLDPSNKDADFNLQLLNNELFGEQNVVPPSFFTQAWRYLYKLFSLNGWSILFIILQFVFPALILLFFFSNNTRKRRLFFYSSLFFFWLYIISMSQSIYGYYQMKNPGSAIIKNSLVSVKSSPSLDAIDIIVVEQGVKVNILEQTDEWSKVVLPDGIQGWIISEYVIELSATIP